MSKPKPSVSLFKKAATNPTTTRLFGFRDVPGTPYFKFVQIQEDMTGARVETVGEPEARPVVFERMKIAMMKSYVREQ